MKKILVAEDEQAIREFVVINLRRAGYDTLEAGTGEEASGICGTDLQCRNLSGYGKSAFRYEGTGCSEKDRCSYGKRNLGTDSGKAG